MSRYSSVASLAALHHVSRRSPPSQRMCRLAAARRAVYSCSAISKDERPTSDSKELRKWAWIKVHPKSHL